MTVDDANELEKRSGRLYCREVIKFFETQVYPRRACDALGVVVSRAFGFGVSFKDVRRRFASAYLRLDLSD